MSDQAPTREDFERAVDWLHRGYDARYFQPPRAVCESIVRVLWSRAGVDRLEDEQA